MAPYTRNNDVLPEILHRIFGYFTTNKLLSLSINLFAKGLRAFKARLKFQLLDFGINKDSLERLWRLSKYPGAADAVKPLVTDTVGVQRRGLEDFLKFQWERHLKDYRRRCPMPKCVTMDDVHKAVGVKNWRSCRTCASLAPRQQFNHFIRYGSE